jgi:hypothetical protein
VVLSRLVSWAGAAGCPAAPFSWSSRVVGANLIGFAWGRGNRRRQRRGVKTQQRLAKSGLATSHAVSVGERGDGAGTGRRQGSRRAAVGQGQQQARAAGRQGSRQAVPALCTSEATHDGPHETGETAARAARCVARRRYTQSGIAGGWANALLVRPWRSPGAPQQPSSPGADTHKSYHPRPPT